MGRISVSVSPGPVRTVLTVICVLAALVAAGFALKAYAAPLEIGLSQSIHDLFASGPLWGVSSLVSTYMAYVIVAGFAVLVANPGTRRLGIRLMIQVFLVWLFQEIIIKNIVMRPRPYVYLGIPSPLAQMSDLTYFSGHSQTAFAFAGFFWECRRRISFAFISIGLFVMFTRIIVYAHYFSDVVIGAAFGFAGGVFFYLWGTGRLRLTVPKFMEPDADSPPDGAPAPSGNGHRCTPSLRGISVQRDIT